MFCLFKRSLTTVTHVCNAKYEPLSIANFNKLLSILHPRSAEYRRARKKRFPMRCLQPWTCLQAQVLPRQWMVGPSSDSRPLLRETSAGVNSAVNGRARRWRKSPAGTSQPLQPTCRPQHYEKTAAPKMLPPLKLVRRVSWDSQTVIGTVKARMTEG